MTVLSDHSLRALPDLVMPTQLRSIQPCSIDLHLGPSLLRLTGAPIPTVKIPLRFQDGAIRAYALIDATDAEWANQWQWSLTDTGYAVRTRTANGRRGNVRLHRELLGLTEADKVEVDHINRDRLDCRRSNLRIVTHQGNMQNRNGNSGTSSVHRGVVWSKSRSKWQAYIKVEGKSKYLGSFTDEQEAARVAREARERFFPWSIEQPEQIAAPVVVLDPEQDQAGIWVDAPLREDGRWLIGARELFLGATLERVTVPDDQMALLHGISSLGRYGLLIHVTAGLVDPGWNGNLTLEIVSMGGPIYLKPGMRIGQVTFHRLTSAAEHPYAGRYQGDAAPTPSRSYREVTA